MSKTKKILIIFFFLIILIFIFTFILKSYLEPNNFDLQNPSKCISATSQCNVCGRESDTDTFICTEMLCQNEKFICTKYQKDKVKNLDKNNAEALRKAIQEISLDIDLPDIPDEKLDSKTVLGIDSNQNGIRDKNEIIIYQGLNLLIDNEKIFKDALQFVNLIEPSSEEIILNSKDEHEIYCSYKKLPLIVQKELPLDFVYSFVLDTEKRKKVFYGSLKNTNDNYGKEECDQ